MPRQHDVECVTPDVGLHDHARAATEGGVVHGVMHVGRPGAQVMDAEVDVPAHGGLADQRDAERPGITDPPVRADGPEVVREDGDDIDPHVNPNAGIMATRVGARGWRRQGSLHG